MKEGDFLILCEEKSYTAAEIVLFQKALELAKKILGDKKRINGEYFWEHNLNVGAILAENRSSSEIVLAGILHGLSHAEEEIKAIFGEEVLFLVHGVGELEKLKLQNKNLEAEALRKILLTTLKDIRVIIVKLANKLENLRSVEFLPLDEQRRIAGEVFTVYAPLAYRLGLEKIKVQLEDLALKITNPRKYKEIAAFLEESQEEREKSVAQAIHLIAEIAQDKVKIIKIKGRSKHIYSIYRKITERGVNLNDQYDLLGIRVIVPEVKDCYNLLGLLHENWEPIDGRLKDYIANPKPNFYRSIHTGLILPNGKILEVQIRTPEMNEFAEEGIAAHWRYKKLSSEETFEKKLSWIKGILDLQKETKETEFLEAAKVDIFGDKIYCYTPKGEVKELPKSATILDFAFFVHEQVGCQAVGGRVNGKFVNLQYELAQGDVVEIITNKNQRPRRTWVKIVKSARARQKIRKKLKEYEQLPAFYYRKIKVDADSEQGVLVESEEFPLALCLLAKCCHPIPGEKIIGIFTKKRTISVHKDDCHQALKEEERWLPVRWKESFNQKIKFSVYAQERSGVLADLLHTLALAGFEVKEAKAKMFDVSYVLCSFVVIPRDLENLTELIRRVLKVKSVQKVQFE